MMDDTRRVTWWALGALGSGLLVGAALATADFRYLENVIAVAEPIGALWVNAVRMTVVPLVVSMLVVSVGSTDTLRSMGRLGGSAFAYFLLTLIAVGIATALLAPPLFAGLSIDADAAASLRRTASAAAQQVTTTVRGMGGFTQRVVEMVPPNPVRAAADGAMLPIVVFAIIFGAALSRVSPAAREAPIRFFNGVAEAMLVIIRWVFAVAPIGVFALAVVVGARLGYTAVTAVGYYLGVFTLLIGLALLLAYLTAVGLGRMSLRRFASAVAPAQVIALGSRSSSAALPALIGAARDVLQLPAPIVSFVLPTAVAVFRISAPISFVLGALFLGKLYGVPIASGQVVSLVVLSILLSYSVPPVPSGSLFLMAPVFAELGIPVEGVAILIAIDVIPDLMKTATIVTAHMASAVVVARWTSPAEPGVAPPPATTAARVPAR